MRDAWSWSWKGGGGISTVEASTDGVFRGEGRFGKRRAIMRRQRLLYTISITSMEKAGWPTKSPRADGFTVNIPRTTFV